MILPGKKISQLIKTGEIKIEPSSEVNETAIKIHLLIENETYQLAPKEFLLTKTLEKISLSSQYAGLYDGYAGTSVLGLLTHLGSMLVQPNFSGQLTLEMFNVSNKIITLNKGMRVGNLLILKLG